MHLKAGILHTSASCENIENELLSLSFTIIHWFQHAVNQCYLLGQSQHNLHPLREGSKLSETKILEATFGKVWDWGLKAGPCTSAASDIHVKWVKWYKNLSPGRATKAKACSSAFLESLGLREGQSGVAFFTTFERRQSMSLCRYCDSFFQVEARQAERIIMPTLIIIDLHCINFGRTNFRFEHCFAPVSQQKPMQAQTHLVSDPFKASREDMNACDICCSC